MSLAKASLAAALALSVLAAPAAAQIIVPVSQDRLVSARAELGLGGGPLSSESFQAPDFGPFNQSASATESIPSQGILADAGATQDSSIGSDRIVARGSYFATVEDDFTDAQARTVCEFVFDVTQTCRYDLVGSVQSFDFGTTSVTIRNEDTSSAVYLGFTVDLSNDFPVDLTGVLIPGRYLFRAGGFGSVQDGSPFAFASGAYDLDLLLTPVTSSDCVATRNSSGGMASLEMTGEFRVGSNDTFWRVVQGPPGNFGLLLYGDGMPPAAFGNGVLCVSSPLYRIPDVRAFDASGSARSSISYPGVPIGAGPGKILAGSTWTFQFWFRDVPQPGGGGWNTSTAVTVTFGT